MPGTSPVCLPASVPWSWPSVKSFSRSVPPLPSRAPTRQPEASKRLRSAYPRSPLLIAGFLRKRRPLSAPIGHSSHSPASFDGASPLGSVITPCHPHPALSRPRNAPRLPPKQPRSALPGPSWTCAKTSRTKHSCALTFRPPASSLPIGTNLPRSSAAPSSCAALASPVLNWSQPSARPGPTRPREGRQASPSACASSSP